MEEEEEEGRALGGGGGGGTETTTTTTTTMNKMSTEMATYRSGRGGTGGGGPGILPSIDKNDYDLNMNARRGRTTGPRPRPRLESAKKKEEYMPIWDGPPPSWRAGGLICMLIQRGGVLTKIILGKTNNNLKQGIILPQTKYHRGRIT